MGLCVCVCADVPSSSSERAARYEAPDRTSARNCWNLASRSLTIMIPNEDGPKASVRVSKETEPARAGQHGYAGLVLLLHRICLYICAHRLSGPGDSQ